MRVASPFARPASFVVSCLLYCGILPLHGGTLPEELQSLVDRASGLNVEVYCDVVLRVCDRLGAADAKEKSALLEAAFVSAAELPHSAPVVFSGPTTDTSCWMDGEVSRLSLDRLSIQTAAVQRLAAINPKRAMELYRLIRKPVSQKSPCGTELTTDISALYTTLSVLRKATAPRSTQRQSDVIDLIQGQFSAITDLEELVPALTLLEEVATDDAVLMMLGSTLSQQLSILPRSPHAYQLAVRNDLRRKMLWHLQTLHARALPLAGPLEAYRSLLLKQTLPGRSSGERQCPAEGPARSPSVAELFDPRVGFNLFVNSLGSSTASMALPIDSTSNSELAAPAASQSIPCRAYWGSQAERRFLEGLRSLRNSAEASPRPLTPDERLSPMWETRSRELILDVLAWKPESEHGAEDLLHQKCIILRRLLSLAPPSSPIRSRVLDAIVSVIGSFPLGGPNTSRLMYEIDSVLRQTRKASDADLREIRKAQKANIQIPNLPIPEPDAVRQILRAAANPLVSFLTLVEDVCPRDYGSWTN